MAPERTAQRVGSVAHIGGFFEALFVSKLGDAISQRSKKTVRVAGQTVDKIGHDAGVVILAGVARARTCGNPDLSSSAHWLGGARGRGGGATTDRRCRLDRFDQAPGSPR